MFTNHVSSPDKMRRALYANVTIAYYQNWTLSIYIVIGIVISIAIIIAIYLGCYISPPRGMNDSNCSAITTNTAAFYAFYDQALSSHTNLIYKICQEFTWTTLERLLNNFTISKKEENSSVDKRQIERERERGRYKAVSK